MPSQSKKIKPAIEKQKITKKRKQINFNSQKHYFIITNHSSKSRKTSINHSTAKSHQQQNHYQFFRKINSPEGKRYQRITIKSQTKKINRKELQIYYQTITA